jgi:hypothetical protein
MYRYITITCAAAHLRRFECCTKPKYGGIRGVYSKGSSLVLYNIQIIKMREVVDREEVDAVVPDNAQ